jgi:ABC transport system ATP-binding/permease protein
MAILLSSQGLRKSFGARPLFDGLSFGISEGERIGLLGANGSGKSTLLKLLAGQERPDGGTLSIRRNARLGYVPQSDVFDPEQTVQQVLSQALQDEGRGASSHTWADGEGGKALRVEMMLSTLEFDEPDQPAGMLSGGGRKRLAIARELIREPDLLLLDEPTNHLDLEGILWLERVLQEAPFAYLLVSHDRYLLQNATNRVVELSRAYADGYFSVNGSYADFLLRREEYLQAQAHQQEVLATKVRREVEWLRQNAPARSTKSQARIRDAGRLMEDLAEVRLRNTRERAAGIDFDATRRKTRDLLVAKQVEKRLGERTLFTRLDLVLSPGMKLGLMGPNGSGKTTLLRVLTGDLAPDAGTIRRAEGLRTVYFDQHRERLSPNVPLKDALSPAGDTVVYRDRAIHHIAWAKRFLFQPEQLGMPVGQLSGGEQARVLIARMMLEPADLLILDEPTNDLDIPTLEILEESLSEFPGALVLVTHDRYLLDRICTELLGLDGRGGAVRYADYSQWERAQAAREAPAAPPREPEKTAKGPDSWGRLTTAEQRELNRMHERIEAAEREVERLQQEMATPAVASDHVRLRECWAAPEAAQQKVAALYARWEELEG